MKNIITYYGLQSFILALMLIALLFSCEEREFDNPYDPDVDISEYVPYDLEISAPKFYEPVLSWKCKAEKYTGFLIERKEGEGAWAKVAETKTLTWTDTDIEIDQEYQYRIKTVFGSKSTADIKTSFNSSIPAPTDLKTEKISDISYRLNWNDPIKGEQGFRIDRRRSGEDWICPYAEIAANQTEYIDTNVFVNSMRNLNIEYRIYAYYEKYESEKIQANTNAAISMPSDLTITQNSLTSVSLNWMDNSEGAEGFQIERKQGTEAWELLTVVSETTYIDDSFELNSEISYRIAAYYGQYYSDFIENSFNTQIHAPDNLIITQNSIAAVTLNWQDNTEGEEGFRIERKQGNAAWELLTITSETTQIDDSFELNSEISYRIAAYYGQYFSDFIENGFNSEIPTPKNLSFTQNSATSITLNWSYSQSGQEGFKIERKKDNGSWGILADNLNPGQYSFTDDRLDFIQNKYTYRVYALCNELHSNYAEVIIQYNLSIGDIYKGGIVFYLDNEGGGLVCAEGDQGAEAEWGCYATSIDGTSVDIGTGAANTSAILSICTQTSIAARICQNLALNGYTDWFLPSKDELNLMYENLRLIGIGGFANNFYWSSSQCDSYFSWTQDFANGSQGKALKGSNRSVRAVRAF